MVTRGGGGHEYDHVPPKFLQIKQEDKFFSRLLSKETSKGEASFRVLYYGGAAGAVPFMWESRPGTPKHTLSDTSPPPLTPPPSYQVSPRIVNSAHQQSKPKFLQFLRKSRKKSGTEAASFASSSFSSSYSLPSTPMNSCTASRRKWDCRSSSDVHFGFDEDEDEDEQAVISPTSTLCFRSGSRSCSSGKFRSYYGMKNVKKALLSIVGHDTA